MAMKRTCSASWLLMTLGFRVKESKSQIKMKKLLYCVYVLLSLKDNQFYIGYTTNLHERLTAHINGHSEATELPKTIYFIVL